MMAALWSLENRIESVFRPNATKKSDFIFGAFVLLTAYENSTCVFNE
jgi:hypothetical protein